MSKEHKIHVVNMTWLAEPDMNKTNTGSQKLYIFIK